MADRGHDRIEPGRPASATSELNRATATARGRGAIPSETGLDYRTTADPGLRARVMALVPLGIFRTLRNARYSLSLARNHLHDYRRNRRWTSAVERGDTEQKLAALITMSYHGIEKGLALREPRTGFGVAAIELLLRRLDRYLDHAGPGPVAWAALNALDEYWAFNERRGHVDATLRARLDDLHDRAGREANHGRGGTKHRTRHEVHHDARMDLTAFFASRSSIRNFAPEPVDVGLVRDAVRMAQKTPSVCNRQSSRVWMLTSEQSKADALRVQGGSRGFAEQVDKVLVVTSDLTAFQSAGERNQAWVDGGMFAMSLVYALHSLGLGTCCLNWSKKFEVDRELREYVPIPEQEVIIMMIAVGHLPDEFDVPQSPMKSVDEAFRVLP